MARIGITVRVVRGCHVSRGLVTLCLVTFVCLGVYVILGKVYLEDLVLGGC